MVRNKYGLLMLLLLVIYSCQKKTVDENLIGSTPLSKKDLKIQTIKVEFMNLDEIETSYTGFFKILDDQIYFIDRRFGWVFIFDKDGKLLGQKLGQGKGPYELNTSYVDAHLILPNKKHLFLGSALDTHLHDENYLREQTFIVNWVGSKNIEQVRTQPNPDPEEFALYTLDYENLILRADTKGNIYIPVYGETQYFNAFSNENYYKEGRILARLNLETKKVDKLIGKRSPDYLKYKYLGHHSFFYYDIDSKDRFYISHEIDSLIYVYNSDFQDVLTFGNAGIGMDTRYTEVTEFNKNKIKDAYFNDRPKRGYYHYVEYFDEFDILFRSYTKGQRDNYDGLQIYKSAILIGDVEVPKGLVVKGYIAPYFYCESFIEDDEELKLYRFKINPEFLK